MTRFDASAPADRRALFADGIAAHRQRHTGFLTVEVEADRRDSDGAGNSDGSGGPDEDEPALSPWIQFEDGTLNLDCTDAELDRLTRLLDEFPAFTIEKLTSPENAEGTNVRVSARVDDERIGAFIEAVFRNAYERPEDYRVWVTTL